MSTDYEIGVNSPCTGNQEVKNITTNIWAGASGNFSYAVLALNGSATRFGVTVYAYSGSCAPQKYYEQMTADTTDPAGNYGLVVGGNPPDNALGELTVTLL